jgi:hypothetical protein
MEGKEAFDLLGHAVKMLSGIRHGSCKGGCSYRAHSRNGRQTRVLQRCQAEPGGELAARPELMPNSASCLRIMFTS